MEEKQPEGIAQEVYRVSEADIKRRGIRQCVNHKWRKLSDNEVACTLCNTALIVDDITKYD